MIERLRDALGTIRVLYLATSELDRLAIRRAGSAVANTLAVAESRRREKELHSRLAIARRDLERAASEVPKAAPVLRAVLAHLKPLGGGAASLAADGDRPVTQPPWWNR